MADQTKTTSATTPDVLQRAKGFWEKNSRIIIIVGSVVILLAGGYYGYKYFYKLPREEKANEQLFAAEKLLAKMTTMGSYNKDSVNIVLNGGNLDGVPITGLLKIISNYGGTKSGDRAQYLVGACYLHIQDYDKAIKYLKDFDGNGAQQIQSKAYMLLGDAYAEKKNTDEALSYYKKAASVLDDKEAWQKAFALFMAANYADYAGKTKEAIDILQDIKQNHMVGILPQEKQDDPRPAVTVDDVDKLLAKLGVTK